MKKRSKKIKVFGGLNQLPYDKRDIKFEKVFGAVKLPEEDFIVSLPLEIKDQGTDDKCTANAVCGASEAQESVILDVDWQFAQTKRITGNYTTWGADLRSAAKSAVKVGSIQKSKVKRPDVDEGELRNWEHWDKINEVNAIFHKKLTYTRADTGGLDTFDGIRNALWQGRNKKQLVITGCLWRQEWNYVSKGIIPNTEYPPSFGHAFIIIGQKKINNEIHLVAQLSNGKYIGDNGLFYFPREIVNKEFTFGSFVFVDMPVEKARILNEAKWRWFGKIIAFIKGL